MQRYHDALRATGHKITERFVPTGGALLTSNSFTRTTTTTQQLQHSARRSFAQQGITQGQGGTSVAESQTSTSGYNRHVHHSYGSLPVRSPATESYVAHFSPPEANGDITPGGAGHLASRSRIGQFDAPQSTRRNLASNHHDEAHPLPPLADQHDHFEDADAAAY